MASVWSAAGDTASTSYLVGGSGRTYVYAALLTRRGPSSFRSAACELDGVGKFWSGGSFVVKLLDFGRSVIENVFSLVLVESYRAFWWPAVVM
jgi:hypothetical protein